MIALTATPVLETDRLTLRAPQARDWEDFAAFLTSDRASFVGGPVPRDKAWRAFGHQIGHWVLRGFGMFYFSLKGAAAPIGMAGPWYPESWPEREIGWSLWSAEAEGKGYAFEAARAARDFAFHGLGWQTAVSYIAPENTRSIALATRLGAALESGAPCPGDEPCLVFRHPAPQVPA
jgi:RimJ/RimL family protein N-acetyltransferase